MIYDINLIPKNKLKTSTNSNVILLVLLLITAAVTAAFGFYLPCRQKLSFKRQILKQEETLKNYSDELCCYDTLMGQLGEFKNTELLLDTIKSNHLEMTAVLDDIENCIPREIIINSISMEAGLLTIGGTSPTYTGVAGFIVNLKTLENISEVTFMSASAENPSAGEGTQQSSGEQLFDFEIYIKYNTADAFTDLIAAQAATVNAEEGEVVPDEAD